MKKIFYKIATLTHPDKQVAKNLPPQKAEEVEKIFKSVSKILNLININDFNIFFNNDPRGYALKIDDEFVSKNKLEIHCDWGGNGILAPDFIDA